tara:strand:- start:817 stop:1116 length:300 start_codon:yes stop_codon:yes gene_type:complete
MEVFLYVAILIAVFILGISVGAIIENRRITLLDRINSLERITQEIFLPLANKIEHIDVYAHPRPSTLVDHKCEDPDATMEMPKIKIQERGKHAERKEAW